MTAAVLFAWLTYLSTWFVFTCMDVARESMLRIRGLR